MNRTQQLMDRFNKLSLDLTNITQEVSILVNIPPEVQKWYHLLHYIRLANSDTQYQLTYNTSNNRRTSVTVCSKLIKSIQLDGQWHQWVVIIEDLILCLKDVVDVVELESPVLKRVKVDSQEEQQDTNMTPLCQPLDSCSTYPIVTTVPLDLSNWPQHLEKLTTSQIKLIKEYSMSKVVGGCPVIAKPTLHEENNKWFLQLISTHGCYRWKFTPAEACIQLGKLNECQDPDSNLTYREYSDKYDYSNLSEKVTKMHNFLHLFKQVCSKLNWVGNTHRPAVKVLHKSGCARTVLGRPNS